jgi:transposase
VQQRVFGVERFVRSNSVVDVRRAFRREVPSRKTVRAWVREWRETCSVKDKKPGRRRTVRKPENVEHVRVALERSPRRSARLHASALHLSRRSLSRILHADLKFHPYKLQLVQQLSQHGKEVRLRFCQDFMNMTAESRIVTHNVNIRRDQFPSARFCQQAEFPVLV